MTENVYVKADGVQKEVTSIKTKVSGTWKDVDAVFTKVGGTWKKVFPQSTTLKLSGTSGQLNFANTVINNNQWDPRSPGYRTTRPWNIQSTNSTFYSSVTSRRIIVGYTNSGSGGGSTFDGSIARGVATRWNPRAPIYATEITGYQFNTTNFTGYGRPTQYGDPSPIMFLPEGRLSPTITKQDQSGTSSISTFAARTSGYNHDTSLPVIRSGTQPLKINITGSITLGGNRRDTQRGIEVWACVTPKPKLTGSTPQSYGTGSTKSLRNGGIGYPSRFLLDNNPVIHYSRGPWRKLTFHPCIGTTTIDSGVKTVNLNIPEGHAVYFGISHGYSTGAGLQYTVTSANIEFTNG